MSDCNECENYYEELDVNYQDCKVNADEKYWFSKIECPYFKERYEIGGN